MVGQSLVRPGISKKEKILCMNITLDVTVRAARISVKQQAASYKQQASSSKQLNT